MAFSFDSALGAFALLLAGTSGWSWARARHGRAGARLNLRFASVLFASLSAAGLIAAAMPAFGAAALAVALLTASLAAPALAMALAAKRIPPLAASFGLGLGLVAALSAMLSGAALLAVGFQLLIGAAMLGHAAERFSRKPRAAALSALAALALMLGGACLLRENLAGGVLFFAAALWGAVCASEAGVEQHRGPAWRRSIGGLPI